MCKRVGKQGLPKRGVGGKQRVYRVGKRAFLESIAFIQKALRQRFAARLDHGAVHALRNGAACGMKYGLKQRAALLFVRKAGV